MTSAQAPLQEVLEKNGITFPPQAYSQLQTLEDVFLQWNERLNLISRKDTQEFWKTHLLHSLSILSLRELPQGAEVCDLGTGGGLPGLPLAIVRPDLQLTLIDSTQKKIKAVQDMIETLKLPNATAVWGRAEELGKQRKYRRRFPIILARAVSAAENLEKWTQAIRTSKNACIHSYKGGDLTEELEAFRKHFPQVKVVESAIALEGVSEFTTNQKKIVSFYF